MGQFIIQFTKTFKELEKKYNNKKNYVKVTDIVAGYIQDKIIEKSFNDSLKWNIYLIFSIEEKLVELKYNRLVEEIEYDKFCCKKYVLSVEGVESLNQKMEKHLPIFINLDRKTPKDELEEKGKLKLKKRKMPKAIEEYLAETKFTLEELLELKFDMDLIKKIYKGEENEN